MSTRVFAEADAPGSITLGAEESHYLVRVRRARVGTRVEVLGPESGGWSAEVTGAHPKHATVQLHAPLSPRPPRLVDLVVGLPDAKAAYEVVARATEIGARSLAFVSTERSVPGRLNAARLARVHAAARRQCGRLDPLQIADPQPLDTWLAQPRAGFVASLAPPGPPRGPAPRPPEPSVLIGPEGGLTPSEERSALEAGLIPVSLGPFVLRTEVAVVAAVARTGRIPGE